MDVSKDVIMIVAKDLLVAAMDGKHGYALKPANMGKELTDIAEKYKEMLELVAEASKGMTG